MGSSCGERLITILCIDGGGVRGIIPAAILKSLEDELQKLEGDKNKKVRLADYFDIIAGTSTGALITAMLTTPPSPNDNDNEEEDHERPLTAQQIIDFYYNKGPLVFTNGPPPVTITLDSTHKEKVVSPPPPPPMPAVEAKGSFKTKLKKVSQKVFDSAKEVAKDVARLTMEAVHDGYHLGRAAEDLGRGTQLKDTLTNVVIPAYDVKQLKPFIFTTRLAKKQSSEIKLADVAVSSASAPYYFPPKAFEADGKFYKLVDGGIVANNPTVLAIEEARKLFGAPADYSKYLILSLGTGKEKNNHGHSVTGGGPLEWFFFIGQVPPLVDVLFRASDDVVDKTTSFILGQHNSHHNYLRIQDCELTPELAKINDASKKQLDELKNVWEERLKPGYVAIPDPETGLPTVMSKQDAQGLPPSKRPPTNQYQLKRFAEKLYDERRRRLS